jgi:class 3 adenylate cyclase
MRPVQICFGRRFLRQFRGLARAIRCACAITDSVQDLGIAVRAGLHTGECEVVDGKVTGSPSLLERA